MVAGGSAELIAGEKIRLLPGLQVMPGGYLHARISPTGPFCSGSHDGQEPREDCRKNVVERTMCDDGQGSDPMSQKLPVSEPGHEMGPHIHPASGRMNDRPPEMACWHGNGAKKEIAADFGNEGSKFFRLYPNPGRGLYTLELAAHLQGKEMGLQVLASDGRHVSGKTFRAATLHQLNLQGQDRGVYMLILSSGDKRTVKRLILW